MMTFRNSISRAIIFLAELRIVTFPPISILTLKRIRYRAANKHQ